MQIGTVEIGARHVYVIAEAGVNHNGQKDLALQLIDAAKEAGADAVKFQTFTPEEVVSENAPQAEYQKANTGTDESQSEMLKGLALPYETFRELYEYAKNTDIEFLSTPFGYADADFLETLGVAAFKVSSGDLTNLPFLAYLGKKKRPVIISTGMATIDEIRDAVKTLEENGCENLVVMQCTSEYPTPPSHVNLRVLGTLRSAFRHPIGFSDHTEGIIASPAAVSLGAAVIEKHFTLDKKLSGPDHKASLEPRELREMIVKIRGLENGTEMDVPEELLGVSEKEPSDEEKRIAKLVRRGIAARTDIKEGETITQENTHAIRPEGQILPKDWVKIIGKKAVCPIPRGKSLTWDMLGL